MTKKEFLQASVLLKLFDEILEILAQPPELTSIAGDITERDEIDLEIIERHKLLYQNVCHEYALFWSNRIALLNKSPEKDPDFGPTIFIDTNPRLIGDTNTHLFPDCTWDIGVGQSYFT